MRGKDLFMDMTFVDERLIQSAEITTKERFTLPFPVKKRWVMPAAGVCMIFCLFFICISTLPNLMGNWKTNSLNNVSIELNGSNSAKGDNDNPLTQKIINGYGAANSASACYATPKPGKWFCFMEVNEARKAYVGQNVTFLLAFDIFAAEGKTLTEDEKVVEYQRLASLGYHLYEANYWNYIGTGQKVTKTTVVGLFTEEQLSQFLANENYGYAFYFIHNGDNSSINFDIDHAVSLFPTHNQ